MASPARSLTPREEAGVLRDFYLVLWKQLDMQSGESKWFDVAAVSTPDLQGRADELLSRLVELQTTPELLGTAQNDRQRLLAALHNPPNAEQADALKAYLRDSALDFAQQAAHLR